MEDAVSNSRYGRYDSLLENFEDNEPDRIIFDPGSEIGETYLDSASFEIIEIESLVNTFDQPQLKLGKIALYRALTNPSMKADEIIHRQEGLRELSENSELRDDFIELIDDIEEHEEGLFDLMWGRFVGFSSPDSRYTRDRSGYGYEAFKHSRDFFLAVQKKSLSITQPKTPFLQSILDDLKLVNTNRTSKLIVEGAYLSEKKALLKEEKKWWTPAYRFKPSIFRPIIFAVLMLVIWSIFSYFSQVHGGLDSAIGPMILLMVFPLFFLTIVMIGSFDRDQFIAPLGKKLRKEPEMQSVLDALAEIEILLTHDKFAQQFPGNVCLPTIIEADQHQLTVENLWNAPIGTANGTYVGNDISLTNERINFITGPNSGGKTALCKTLCQAQILGQSGGYVPAAKMSLSVVKHIFYQAPEAGSLDSAQGRFATELQRTRDIFFNCKEPCLVVLDEPFEGTSVEERLEITAQVLDGFIRTGASILFITHNFSLVHLYKEKSIGQFLETVFENNTFTYRFKEGIASTSHADRVVEKLGFSMKDIENHLNK